MLVVVLQHGDGELGKTYLLELVNHGKGLKLCSMNNGKPLMGFH
jgi:hypothetical protein